MCDGKHIVFLIALVQLSCGVRINFTSCQNPEWRCVNNNPTDIIYTCSVLKNHDFIIHIKDYYTDQIKSVTVQNCKDLRVVLDCPLLQQSSQLQQFKIRNCDRIEFVTLSETSSLQTPPEVVIENIREITSLPTNIFKSPININEFKCLGTTRLRKIRVTNSKISTIHTNAIHNVTGIKNIEFDNVTISNIKINALNIAARNEDSVFSITNSRIHNIESNAITIDSTITTFIGNEFSDLFSNAINVTSEYFQMNNNKFNDLYERSIEIRSVNIDVSYNVINRLKRNAFAEWKCSKKRAARRKMFKVSNNIINNIELYSLLFDYNSCRRAGTEVILTNNMINCTCRNIAFLNSPSFNTEISQAILNTDSNNTCLSAPCILPVAVVKQLMESDMCQINLDLEVMCLLYNDKHASTHSVSTVEDVTEPVPTFYLIRQANTVKGGAAMTAINTEELLRETNMKNKTSIHVIFDASQDFVEALRSPGNSQRRFQSSTQRPKSDRCSGSQCKPTGGLDRQKALDFYKYVYAQLRPPKNK